jgi:hypothetical protein
MLHEFQHDVIPNGDICCVMSKSSMRHANLAQTEHHVSFHDYLTVKNLSLIDRGANGGVTGEDVRVAFRTNRTVESLTVKNLSLIDHGANGGVTGEDVRVTFHTKRTVDIKGIDNHHISNIGIGTIGGVVKTQGSLSLPLCTNMPC